jgi:hypothetical protein
VNSPKLLVQDWLSNYLQQFFLQIGTEYCH